MKGIVYSISFWPIDKYYVGVTGNLAARKINHLYHLKNGSHICRPLQKAFNDFGATEIEFCVESVCEWSERFEREKEVARRYGDGRLFNAGLLRHD